MAGKLKLRDELMFPSDYVCAVELKGRDVKLTIATVAMENLKMRGGAEKRRPVLTFKESKKKLALNVTNGESIAAMYGNQALDWIGKQITIYPTTTKFGRETVDCIRVRLVRTEKPGADDAPPPEEPTIPLDDLSGCTDQPETAAV